MQLVCSTAARTSKVGTAIVPVVRIQTGTDLIARGGTKAMATESDDIPELKAALLAARAADASGDEFRTRAAKTYLRHALVLAPPARINENSDAVAGAVRLLGNADDDGTRTLTVYQRVRPFDRLGPTPPALPDTGQNGDIVRWFTLFKDGDLYWEHYGGRDSSS